ncbi:putative immunity protein [Nocardia altamirensis]|uniref:putative immunity protein n=1 Tax=Nocardia altamirensis TaxID=472158 RepID=UPI00083FEC60|nr:hypothetical protein [Nocardia altamirensis]
MTTDRGDHAALALWAAACAEHVLPLFERERPDDARPRAAIEAVRAWARGELSVGEARMAAFDAHESARLEKDASAYAARSAGHAASTAHLCAHAVHAATYAVKAAQAYSSEGERERAWQESQLSERLFRVVFPDQRLSEHGR